MPNPPFPSATAAWFWTMATIEARHRPPGTVRIPPPGLEHAPCHPDEIVRCVDDLYRDRRIVLLHARILRLYGRRGRAPDPRRPAERCDRRLWTEAIEGLDERLRARGIVAGPPSWLHEG